MFINPSELDDLTKYLAEHFIDSFEDLDQTLEEYQAILNFPGWAASLKNREEREHLELVFHVYPDGKDRFYTRASQALTSYLVYRSQGERNVRLSYELYSDRENDEEEEEDVMIGFGGFPC